MSESKQKNEVPAVVIGRMAQYYRVIRTLDYNGVEEISSSELADTLSIGASQIRQDFHWFGSFGRQGRGYKTKLLRREMENILGINRHFGAVLVGVGRMGETLLQNFKFENAGCYVCAAFDTNPDRCQWTINGVEIFPVEEMKSIVGEKHPQIAILAVPAKSADSAAKAIVDAGIPSIWNLTNVNLSGLPDGIKVQDLHMVDSLLMLTSSLNSENNGK